MIKSGTIHETMPGSTLSNQWKRFDECRGQMEPEREQLIDTYINEAERTEGLLPSYIGKMATMIENICQPVDLRRPHAFALYAMSNAEEVARVAFNFSFSELFCRITAMENRHISYGEPIRLWSGFVRNGPAEKLAAHFGYGVITRPRTSEGLATKLLADFTISSAVQSAGQQAPATVSEAAEIMIGKYVKEHVMAERDAYVPVALPLDKNIPAPPQRHWAILPWLMRL